MSFHHSAQNINVEDGHRLVAQLQTEDGEWVDAEFDLNQILGNDNGRSSLTCPYCNIAITTF
jgi:hypothetical protein